MRKNSSPKYRRQGNGARARAFVEFSGRRIYLGPYDSPASREKYHRVLAEWTAAGRQIAVAPAELTVMELAARFWGHAEAYYRRADGMPSRELAHFKRVLRPFKELYGVTRAADFGPRALKAIRERLVEAGGCRRYVNASIDKLKRVFKWAVAEELVPPAVFHALQTVPGLKRGRCDAREPEPVRPVPEEHVEAVRPHVSRQVWALVQLQLLTAARAGELLPMRSVEINMSGKVWTYSPAAHKTAHHGHQRMIFLGPRAQEVIRPFLANRPLDAFLFSPREAETERRAAAHAQRQTPASCGNSPGTNRARNPRRPPGEDYNIHSYGRAITRACKVADVPHWHPHQLRHNAATHLRKEFGLDVARVILGHRTPSITEVYAELDRSKALDVMARMG